jgi:hypothetical protein
MTNSSAREGPTRAQAAANAIVMAVGNLISQTRWRYLEPIRARVEGCRNHSPRSSGWFYQANT